MITVFIRYTPKGSRSRAYYNGQRVCLTAVVDLVAQGCPMRARVASRFPDGIRTMTDYPPR